MHDLDASEGAYSAKSPVKTTECKDCFGTGRMPLTTENIDILVREKKDGLPRNLKCRSCSPSRATDGGGWEGEFDEQIGKTVIDSTDGDRGYKEFYLKDEDVYPKIKNFIRTLVTQSSDAGSRELRKFIRVQVESTGNSDQYFTGMTNGMVFALSLLEGGDPQYYETGEKEVKPCHLSTP